MKLNVYVAIAFSIVLSSCSKKDILLTPIIPVEDSIVMDCADAITIDNSIPFTLCGMKTWDSKLFVKNIIDNNLSTYWTTEDSTILVASFKNITHVAGVKMAFWAAQQYKFRIQISLDSMNWKNTSSAQLISSSSKELQVFPLNINAKYIRIIGYGNLGAWPKANSYTELQIFGDSLAETIPIADQLFPFNDSRIHVVASKYVTSNSVYFYPAGGYVQFGIAGTHATVYVLDEQLYRDARVRGGYAIFVDDVLWRGRTIFPLKGSNVTGPYKDSIVISNLPLGEHKIVIVKCKGSATGYFGVTGIKAPALVETGTKSHKLRFYGDSQTEGYGNVPLMGIEHWNNHEDASQGFPIKIAKTLDADYWVTAEGGIGLLAKNDRNQTIDQNWYHKKMYDNPSETEDFSDFPPDAQIICLGRNDGLPDYNTYVNKYVALVKDIYSHYPNSKFFIISAPMDNATRKAQMAPILTGVVDAINKAGIPSWYFQFNGTYNGDYSLHPTAAQDTQIAAELSPFIKLKMNW